MSCYPWSEPRSCECLRQCLATPTIVDVPQPDDRPFACFARRGAAPALQLSDFPGEGAEGATGGAPRAGGAARAGRVPSGRGCLCRVLPDEGVDYYASSEQGAAPISTEALLELYYGKAVEALGPGVTRRRNKELVPLAQCPGAAPGAEAARPPQPPAACCGARPALRALTAPTDSVSGHRLAGNCSWEGACYREPRGGGDLGPPQCKCYAGSDGDSCQARLAAACTNECSGRGRCLRGVCSCDLGYFGLDCSVDLSADSAPRDPVAMPGPLPAAAAARSKATLSAALRPPSSADPQSAWPSAQSARRRAPPRPWAGGGLHPAHGCALPRVYVYELPAWLGVACNVDRGAGDSPTAGYGPYSAPMTLHARLLADWAVRTLDPDEADIFYIPSLLYGYRGNLQPANRYLVKQARCGRGSGAADLQRRERSPVRERRDHRAEDARRHCSGLCCPPAPSGRLPQRALSATGGARRVWLLALRPRAYWCNAWLLRPQLCDSGSDGGESLLGPRWVAAVAVDQKVKLLDTVAGNLFSRGSLAFSQAHYEKLLEMQGDRRKASTTESLADVLLAQGNRSGAEAMYRDVLERFVQLDDVSRIAPKFLDAGGDAGAALGRFGPNMLRGVFVRLKDTMHRYTVLRCLSNALLCRGGEEDNIEAESISRTLYGEEDNEEADAGVKLAEVLRRFDDDAKACEAARLGGYAIEVCAHPECEGRGTKWCRGCNKVKYCCRQHQIEHRATHRDECKHPIAGQDPIRGEDKIDIEALDDDSYRTFFKETLTRAVDVLEPFADPSELDK